MPSALTDQRGLPRLIGPGSDIGAVEIQGAMVNTPFEIIDWRQVNRVGDIVNFALAWNSEIGASYRVEFSRDGRTWDQITPVDDIASQGGLTEIILMFDLGIRTELLIRVVRK